MRKAKLFAILLVMVVLTSSHLPNKKNDLWQSWAEIQQLMLQEKKPILIDMYADWCVYCKKMDVTTYKNDSVYEYLKAHYYRFKFNAESKDSLRWNNKTFGFDKKNKLHEFYQFMAKGNLVLPTTVIIPISGQPYTLAGEMQTKEMETLIKYFSGIYPDKTLSEFTKDYKPHWK